LHAEELQHLCSPQIIIIIIIILIIIFFFCSTALCWALAVFEFLDLITQAAEPLGRGISPLQGLYLHTDQHKHRINAHNTDIHALSGIRTHDPSV
jgi:hypothetical protein